jgi:hypothetical protein
MKTLQADRHCPDVAALKREIRARHRGRRFADVLDNRLLFRRIFNLNAFLGITKEPLSIERP